MRIVPSVGAGTLCPCTATVKQKRGKVSAIETTTTPDGRVAVIVPPGAPAFLPPAGQLVTFQINPEAAVSNDAPSSIPCPVTVELVRPALPDGGSGTSWQRTFEARPGDTFEDVVLAHLRPDDPFEISLDGRPLLSKEGNGWQARPRVTITIRATSTPAMLAYLGVVSTVCLDGESFLYVPIVAGQLHELLVDGVPAMRRR